MRMKPLLAATLAAAMCLGLTACSPAAEPAVKDENNDTEKVITLSENWDFSSGFYPTLTASNASNYGATYWNRNFYNTLVKYDEKGEITGELAETWEMSEDGTSYTFHLREGVKFSDGAALTSTAVKTSFEAAIKELGQYNGSYGKLTVLITSIETPDDNTVIINLSQPYYGALNDLTMCNPLAIVNPAAFNEDLTPKDELKTKTMGTGPYLYDGEFEDNTYTFVRNPYYWGETPEIDSFKVKAIEDADARVLALRNGEIDAILGASRMTYDAYEELSQDKSFGTAVNDKASLTRYMGLNLSKVPFNDSKVRQAVAYALDQDTLCSTVLQGIEQPAETLFERSKPHCDVEQTTYEFDLDKANALMDEAGWIDSDGDGIREKDGQKLELTMSYTTDYGALDDMALTIASQLQKIGFKLTPNGTDMMTWFGAMTSGNYEITIYQSYGGAYDPSSMMTNMNSETSTDPVAMQFSSFLPGGNNLIAELDSTPSEERVNEIYHEILTTIADQCLLVPVSYTREFSAWNSEKIDSYTFYPDSMYVSVANIKLK